MSPSPVQAAPPILERFREVRSFTGSLVEGLAPEDMVVQSMDDVSPTKWHLAHTSWFWEVFVLERFLAGYKPLDPAWHFLFNSYYVHAGERHCRAQRGYLSRPTVAEVLAYRAHVEEGMERLLTDQRDRMAEDPEAGYLMELGLNHEQQHQELMLTDLKHVFGVNPLRPVYRGPRGRDGGAVASAAAPSANGGNRAAPAPLEWVHFPGGIHRVGWEGEGFAYDNEGPLHRRFLEPFSLGRRLVTNGEYLEFMADGGYRRPELWMSAGWAARETHGWTEPFYWERGDGGRRLFTLSGMCPVDPAEPVCHLTWYEADAYARWAGARLPREEEWEVAARASLEAGDPMEGVLADGGRYHPAPVDPNSSALLHQLWGDVWEWTASDYSPYPGFRTAPGAVGEYNGKFMTGQYVLRGGSCATSRSHLRPTYRNFFPPDAAWQFSGVRLARDGDA